MELFVLEGTESVVVIHFCKKGNKDASHILVNLEQIVDDDIFREVVESLGKYWWFTGKEKCILSNALNAYKNGKRPDLYNFSEALLGQHTIEQILP